MQAANATECSCIGYVRYTFPFQIVFFFFFLSVHFNVRTSNIIYRRWPWKNPGNIPTLYEKKKNKKDDEEEEEEI